VSPNPSTWADSSLLGTFWNVLMLQWVGVGIFRRLKCRVLENGSISVGGSRTYLFGWDSKRGIS
jgi:hypothetical protein